MSRVNPIIPGFDMAHHGMILDREKWPCITSYYPCDDQGFQKIRTADFCLVNPAVVMAWHGMANHEAMP